MKKLLFSLVALVASAMAIAQESNFSPVDYVNPLIGTQSTFDFSTGNTYPAIARPWGMNFWTPQTGKMGNG
jgi:putative alpha-1,2-mannosidase